MSFPLPRPFTVPPGSILAPASRGPGAALELCHLRDWTGSQHARRPGDSVGMFWQLSPNGSKLCFDAESEALTITTDLTLVRH